MRYPPTWYVASQSTGYKTVMKTSKIKKKKPALHELSPMQLKTGVVYFTNKLLDYY